MEFLSANSIDSIEQLQAKQIALENKIAELDFNGISNRYEERITSRIYANYSILRFVGQDVRIMKAQQAFRKEKERGNRP